MGSPKLSTSVSAFLQWCQLRRARTTYLNHRRYLTSFVATCTKQNLTSVTRLDVETFSAKRHALQSLQTFFGWCVRYTKWLKVSPCAGIPLPPAGTRNRILDRRELMILKRRAGADLRRLLLGHQETGARPQELREVEWSQLRAVGGVAIDGASLHAGRCYFELVRYKGRDRRHDAMVRRLIVISPRLGRMLWRLRRKLSSVSGKVFLRDSGAPWTYNAVRLRVRRLRAQLNGAGLVDGAGLVTYALRHTFATRLAVRRVSGRVLAELLGHTTERLLVRYVHPSLDDLCATVSAFGVLKLKDKVKC